MIDMDMYKSLARLIIRYSLRIWEQRCSVPKHANSEETCKSTLMALFESEVERYVLRLFC